METGSDFRTAHRDTLTATIIRQQAIIASPEKRVAQTEGRAKSRGSGRMPGLKPKSELTRTQFLPIRHCEHSVAISLQKETSLRQRDCHVAALLAMTKWVRVSKSEGNPVQPREPRKGRPQGIAGPA